MLDAGACGPSRGSPASIWISLFTSLLILWPEKRIHTDLFANAERLGARLEGVPLCCDLVAAFGPVLPRSFAASITSRDWAQVSG